MVWAFITSGVLLGQSSRRWNFLWLYSTASVLLYGGVVAGLFTVEIVEAKVRDIFQYFSTTMNIIPSIMIKNGSRRLKR